MKILQFAACQWSSNLLWSTCKDILKQKPELPRKRMSHRTWRKLQWQKPQSPSEYSLQEPKEKKHKTDQKKMSSRFWRSAKKHITHSNIRKKTSKKALWKEESYEFVDPAAADIVKIDMKNENWRVVAQNVTNFLFSCALEIRMRPPRSCSCSHREPGLWPGPRGGRLMYWLAPLAHHFHTNLHRSHLNNCV